MLHMQGVSKDVCSLVAAVGREISESKEKKDVLDSHWKHSFLEPVTSRFLEVHSLSNPSEDEFRRSLDSYRPTLVYLQGYQLKDKIGSLVLGGRNCETAEAMAGLFSSTLPVMVYLEMSNGEKLAEALHSKGIPYVIYWKKYAPRFAASHFLSALLSVLRSSCAHAWDVFQLAHASYRLYSQQNRCVFSDERKTNGDLGPRLRGNPPQIDVSIPDVDMEDEEGNSLSNLPAIQIHDDGMCLKFLICGAPDSVDEQLLGSLEDGLNALLSIEIRGSKILGKYSALLPLQTEAVSRDVVSMRCDIATTSYAHISILLSGNAQTCFDDQLLEKHIKKDIIEKSPLVQKLTSDEENRPLVSEPRLSASVACGAKVFEVSMKVPVWASQVLRQLALDSSHRGLVALGIASVQGLAVASFDKDDAERILALTSVQSKDDFLDNFCPNGAPVWLRPPPPCRKRFEQLQTSPSLHNEQALANGTAARGKYDGGKDAENNDWVGMPLLLARQRLKVAALRPVPRIHQHKIHYLAETSGRENHNYGQVKDNIAVAPVKPKFVRPSSAYKKSSSRNLQSRQIISLNPLPLKKHGCNRSPIQACSEEEFLKDVMHFLTLRGHTRLIPPGGLADFPDAILNAKRLDLYNLYKEVVSRGGFHVGNGINWKGQVFSKMSNYTMTHRMTGVGNTLKRHYETYLLEYEMAHDDVDGECCLLCHSGAAGDWVNCGMCGEWAHFGCDRRQGLGAFKDYAKTDGLEYICPPCSTTNSKKKQHKISNGFP